MFAKLEVIVKEACASCGVGFYDIDIKNTQHGKIICVFITKIDGISLSDCTKVAKLVNKALDLDDSFIEGSYTLEVSSPGIERPLKLKKHYNSAINEYVKITYNSESTKQNIIGKLVEVNQDYIKIEADNTALEINFSNIQKAKTIYKATQKES